MKKLTTYEGVNYYYRLTEGEFSTHTDVYIFEKFKPENIRQKILYYFGYPDDYQPICRLYGVNVENLNLSKENIKSEFEKGIAEYKKLKARLTEIENNEFI